MCNFRLSETFRRHNPSPIFHLLNTSFLQSNLAGSVLWLTQKTNLILLYKDYKTKLPISNSPITIPFQPPTQQNSPTCSRRSCLSCHPGEVERVPAEHACSRMPLPSLWSPRAPGEELLQPAGKSLLRRGPQGHLGVHLAGRHQAPAPPAGGQESRSICVENRDGYKLPKIHCAPKENKWINK